MNLPTQPPGTSTTEAFELAESTETTGYSAPVDAQSPTAAAPAKMNTLAIVALIAGVLVNLVGIVLGIIALVQIKKTGERGRGLAITGIVLGSVSAVLMVALAVIVTALAISAPRPATDNFDTSSSNSAEPYSYGDDTALDACDDEDHGACADAVAGDAPEVGEAAYAAQVRPAMVAIFQETLPNLTAESINQLYSDEILITLGEAALGRGGTGEQTFVNSLVSGTQGMITDEQATRLYDAVVAAAEAHLK